MKLAVFLLRNLFARDIWRVFRYEPRESLNTHQPIFKDKEPGDCARNTEADIDNIVMWGVDGGKPYPDGHERKEQAHP